MQLSDLKRMSKFEMLLRKNSSDEYVRERLLFRRQGLKHRLHDFNSCSEAVVTNFLE
jgi:hypothetical protein